MRSDVMKTNKLALIYFNETDGNIPDHVKRRISELSECGIDILAVCEKKISMVGREYLERYTKDIYVLSDCNNVCKAWAQAMREYKEMIMDTGYEVIYLMNNFFYGPFCNFADYEKQLNPDSDDICMLDRDKNGKPSVWNFIVFYKKVIDDRAFWDYWQETEKYKWRTIKFKEEVKSFFIARGFKIGDINSASKSKLDQYSFVEKTIFTEKSLIQISRTYGNPVMDMLDQIASFGIQYKNEIVSILNKEYGPEELCGMLGNCFILSEQKNISYTNKNAAIFIFLDKADSIEFVLERTKEITAADVYYYIPSEEIEIDLIQNNIDKARIIVDDQYHLFSLICNHKEVIRQNDFVCFINMNDCGNRIDFNYFFDNSVKNDDYVRQVINTLEANNNIALLIQRYGFYNNQFGKILRGKRGNGKDLKEWRSRLKLVNRKMQKMNEYNFYFQWVRAKVLLDFLSEETFDFNVSGHTLAKCEWLIVPEILHSLGFEMGTIMDNMWAQRTITDIGFVLEEFVQKTLNVDNEKVHSVWGYVRNIKKERKVVKKVTVTRDRLVPIGLKEALRFYVKKKLNSVKNKFRKY